MAAENVQDMNVPNEDALPENVDAPSVEEVVAPPPVVEEKSSEVEDKVVEPSQKLKSSKIEFEVVAPSSSSVVDETVVLNDAVYESEDHKNLSNVLEKVDDSEPIDDKEPTSPVKNEVKPKATVEVVNNEMKETPLELVLAE